MSATVAEVIAAARELLGVPYHHQGRNPVAGLDCVGLAVVVAQRLGIAVADVTGYPMTGNGDLLLRSLGAQYRRVPVEEAEPSDLIACRIRPGGRATHMGILTDRAEGLGLLHTYARAGKVVEHGFVSPWTERTVAVYRWREA